MANNMTMAVWKEFKENELTHSMAHYLMGVRDLIAEQGYARTVDVSRKLNIARSSASIGLHALVDKGFLTEDANKFLSLTAIGQQLADAIIGKKIILKRFFEDILHVPEEQAEVDACKIEHLISVETVSRFLCLFKFLESNKQGKKLMESFSKERLCCAGVKDCSVCVDTCLKEFMS